MVQQFTNESTYNDMGYYKYESNELLDRSKFHLKTSVIINNNKAIQQYSLSENSYYLLHQLEALAFNVDGPFTDVNYGTDGY